MASPTSFDVYTLSYVAFSVNLISNLVNSTNRHIITPK